MAEAPPANGVPKVGGLSRRHFFQWGSLAGGTVAAAFAALSSRRTAAKSAFGPLVDDAEGVVDLPSGFRYRVLFSEGDRMSDGHELRGAPDGMAVFPGPKAGELTLMLNHELAAGAGGVSRWVIDQASLEVVHSNDVLTGTARNCAGGPSPWGWLSCEEVPDGGVWICPVDATSVLQGKDRVRVGAYGTFSHEAVAVDPETLVAYLTEDDGASFFYRMVPHKKDVDPHQGVLEALTLPGRPDFDLSALEIGQSVHIGWVKVEPETARASATKAKAARLHRGEGIWWFEDAVYFTGTSNGQVYRLVPTKHGGKLTLLADTLDAPDNITVAPWGDLFVAEDNGRLNRVRMVDRDGNVSDFARNALQPGGEFAGVCFSPDGRVMFVNMQSVGLTLAITGPFPT